MLKFKLGLRSGSVNGYRIFESNCVLTLQKLHFGDFVQKVYLPFCRRKWERSTVMTNEDRLKHHLTSEFDCRSLGSFDRDDLQAFLDQKARTLSFSVVDHLRWDLKQIFGMPVVEGYLRRSPAVLLFTPRECKRAGIRVMTMDQVRQLFSVLEIRERLIAKPAILCNWSLWPQSEILSDPES